ncbi:MAG: DNA replication/repair protein RecF [Oscillospiraceae bacterium]|jgi:DNA replication and repair protein RecF|nr:DNA replication/repair protein RecF [Oscillospiraceae bacterium]
MRVNRLKAVNYRNLKRFEINPCKNVNIIFGDNAQGKTNLIEGIWLFTGCRSFRGSKDCEYINFENEQAMLELDFFGQGRDQNSKILVSDKKKVELNGVTLSSPSKLTSEFLAVVFSPAHLSIVKDGPSLRRKFLDTAICQLKPKYAGALLQYNRALSQRNALLKDITYHSELYDMLDVWEEKLCSLACVIISQRVEYIKKLEPFLIDIYSGISKGKEEMKISYITDEKIKLNSPADIKSSLVEALKSARKSDIYNGSTNTGPHRDDLGLEINGLLARNFGSQGQQRSCALALKLAEAELIKNITGEQPVILLDDVMSELDSARQDYILNHIKDKQVFITCCEPSALLKMSGGETFKLKEGSLCTCT